jgi:hypothetical protein
VRLHDAETISLDEGAEPAVPAGTSGRRYTDLGRLGRGGTAEVRRVRDHQLDRVVAMKILRPELAERPGPVSRFLAEARTTARLQHPGIVPVYDQGRLPDGRPYFTMREVAGETAGSSTGTSSLAPGHVAGEGGRRARRIHEDAKARRHEEQRTI